MSLGHGTTALPANAPCVLVVDDDKRVLELLELAYASHGFRVLTAADGHEAMQKALTDRPDLLVLDVRLPRKSGLEVCELLRRDPEEMHLPIILVSASGETEARLRGFMAGADDYMAKPFSPKELMARSRRLLVRASEIRETRRRLREVERDLARAQDEVKRSLLETRREQRLRALAIALDRELHRTLDLDDLAARILKEAQARLGVGLTGLLLRDDVVRSFVPYAVRGDGLDRLAQLEFPQSGSLMHLLPALGRPAAVRELERLPELSGETPALIAARVARVAPLMSVGGLEAVLVTDERLDGEEPTRDDLELMAVMCDTAGVALQSARLVRAQIDLQLELAMPVIAEDAVWRSEAASIVDRAARATLLPPRLRGLVAHAVRLGASSRAGQPREALELLAAHDPTGLVSDLLTLMAAADEGLAGVESPEWDRAVEFLTIARRVAAARAAGRPAAAALAQALENCRIDPATIQALEAAVREVAWLAGSAA